MPEWLNKTCSLYDLGKYDDALSYCNRVIEFDEMNFDAWMFKELILRDALKKYEEAIACFDKIIESIEFNKFEDSLQTTVMSAAWANKGACLGELGKPISAMACFKKAIEINKENFYAWYSMGGVHYTLKNLEAAADCLYKAIELRKEDAYAWEFLGHILHKMGLIRESNGAMAYAQKLFEDIDRR